MGLINSKEDVYAFIFLVLVVLCPTGWILNVVKLIMLINQDIHLVAVELALRIVGVFVVPVGAIVGFF